MREMFVQCLSLARFSASILGAADVNTLSTLTGSEDKDELHLDQPKSFHYTIEPSTERSPRTSIRSWNVKELILNFLAGSWRSIFSISWQ